MYHFFAEASDIAGGNVRIAGPDANHIKNVLRMKEGDLILVSDGQGTDYTCRIEKISGREVLCRAVSESGSCGEPAVRFYLFQALTKADKFEYIVQKSVELGAHEIIPVVTERCVVRYDSEKAAQKTARWQKIAESAAKQSRRGIIPRISDIMTFGEALEFVSDEKNGIRISIIPYENFKDMAQTRKILSEIKPGMSAAIFIGPEGGFSKEEIEAAVSGGVMPVSLGNRILRTETAPLMILSVLTFQTEQEEEEGSDARR